jgi:hypothetical protein
VRRKSHSPQLLPRDAGARAGHGRAGHAAKCRVACWTPGFHFLKTFKRKQKPKCVIWRRYKILSSLFSPWCGMGLVWMRATHALVYSLSPYVVF